MNCTCLRNNSGPGGATAALSGLRPFFPPFNCVWLHSVKSTWWQLKAATGQNSSSASTVECVTRNRPQRSFYFLSSCFFFFFCFFLFVTAVQAELFPGLLHSLTFSHHKDKGRRPLKKLDVCDTFISLCAPFLAWLSFFFVFFHFMMCIFFSSGVVGASAWKRAMRVRGPNMATGLSGHPGPPARGAARVEWRTERGSATTPGRESRSTTDIYRNKKSMQQYHNVGKS